MHKELIDILNDYIQKKLLVSTTYDKKEVINEIIKDLSLLCNYCVEEISILQNILNMII